VCLCVKYRFHYLLLVFPQETELTSSSHFLGVLFITDFSSLSVLFSPTLRPSASTLAIFLHLCLFSCFCALLRSAHTDNLARTAPCPTYIVSSQQRLRLPWRSTTRGELIISPNFPPPLHSAKLNRILCPALNQVLLDNPLRPGSYLGSARATIGPLSFFLALHFPQLCSFPFSGAER